MNKNIKKILVFGVLSFVFASGFLANSSLASGVSPGSNADPLVSKSYVDAQISQALAGISNDTLGVMTDSMVKDIAAQVEFSLREELLRNNTAPISSGGAYVPVSALAGQIVIGGEGSEMILRSGRAVGYTATENGIVNVTTGAELFNNSEISTNHLLVVPRDDGRGVKITADAWLIIRGSYRIVY